jgi:hypothetical protein
MSEWQDAPDSVRCHSGYTYAQRPVSFFFAGQNYTVEKIHAEKRLPDGRQFLVQTGDGKLFNLFYNEVKDRWQVQISDRGKSTTQGADPKNHAE